MRLKPILFLSLLLVAGCGSQRQETIDSEGNFTLTDKVTKRYMLIPATYTAARGGMSEMDIQIDGKSLFEYPQTIAPAREQTDYLVPVDLKAYKGRKVTLKLSGIAEGSPVIGGIQFSDENGVDYDEPYRMVYHFTPEFGWNNDPNGLFYKDGLWHMSYQHNPYSVSWGNMSWGHSTSKDLLHWEHHGDILRPDEIGAIFSGSAVIDHDNTAGFGKDAVVAIYTSDRQGERQSIAYSTDGGYTYTKFEGNPVIPDHPTSRNFRDPKVYWIGGQWVMVLSVNQVVEFYGSPDLKNWTLLSDFGEGIGSHLSVWECPDLRKFTYEGKEKWVLFVTIGRDPNGANNTQYFIGDFDGTKFTADPLPYPLWVDQGVNQYAGVTWAEAPDNRTVFIAWLTSSTFPGSEKPATRYFTGGMTLPHDMFLKSNGVHPILASVPSPEVYAGRGAAQALQLGKDGDKVSIPGAQTGAYELDLTFVPTGKKPFGFVLSNSKGEKVTYTFDPAQGILTTDRAESGLQAFARNVGNPIISQIPGRSEYKVQLFIDRMVSEMFVNDGDAVATNCVFPSEYYGTVEVFGAASVKDAVCYPMK